LFIIILHLLKSVNSSCPERFSIFVDAYMRCTPQNTALHLNVQRSYCMLFSEWWLCCVYTLLLLLPPPPIIIVVVIWFGGLFVTQIIYLKHFAWHMSELDRLYWENFQTWKKSHFISGCLRCGVCHCLWIVILVANLSFTESACRLIPAYRIRSLCHRKVDFMSILRTAVSKTNSKQDLNHCIVHWWCYGCTIKKTASM
jgi:hypothetical protein